MMPSGHLYFGFNALKCDKAIISRLFRELGDDECMMVRRNKGVYYVLYYCHRRMSLNSFYNRLRAPEIVAWGLDGLDLKRAFNTELAIMPSQRWYIKGHIHRHSRYYPQYLNRRYFAVQWPYKTDIELLIDASSDIRGYGCGEDSNFVEGIDEGQEEESSICEELGGAIQID